MKFSPSFQTDFVTREQQRDGTSVWSWKVPSCGINWQLGTLTLCNRFDPREIQMVQIPGPRMKVGENPRGLPGGGCWCLELTDALLDVFSGSNIMNSHYFDQVLISHNVLCTFPVLNSNQRVNWMGSSWSFESLAVTDLGSLYGWCITNLILNYGILNHVPGRKYHQCERNVVPSPDVELDPNLRNISRNKRTVLQRNVSFLCPLNGHDHGQLLWLPTFLQSWYLGMIHQDKKALCFISAEQLRQDPNSGAYIKMW